MSNYEFMSNRELKRRLELQKLFIKYLNDAIAKHGEQPGYLRSLEYERGQLRQIMETLEYRRGR